jgi:uncharacterized repeat protein (TIGR04076 family)
VEDFSALSRLIKINCYRNGARTQLSLLSITKRNHRSNLDRRDVKITVLKKLDVGEVHTNFAIDKIPRICPRFQVGQEFISKGMQMPDGFCSWAWADMQRDVVHLALSGNYPWIKQSGTEIVCCTDGLHPVLYKLERI